MNVADVTVGAEDLLSIDDTELSDDAGLSDDAAPADEDVATLEGDVLLFAFAFALLDLVLVPPPAQLNSSSESVEMINRFFFIGR